MSSRGPKRHVDSSLCMGDVLYLLLLLTCALLVVRLGTQSEALLRSQQLRNKPLAVRRHLQQGCPCNHEEGDTCQLAKKD